MSRSGLLLIADISGYTVFLKESELEHARGSLTALLELLVGGTRPPLTVSGLEGDAVFSYAFEDLSLRGQTLVEMIESLYVAFRRAIDSMVLNTQCTCNACANIGNLGAWYAATGHEMPSDFDAASYCDAVPPRWLRVRGRGESGRSDGGVAGSSPPRRTWAA
jgi:hypothetical protein